MLDVLSQAEIDKLMRDLAAGDADNKDDEANSTVKNYDFKTANRFTKEQIKAISVVFKNFGHLFSNHFMGTLRASCDAEVLSIEEISFNEFNTSVPSPVIIAIINASPFTGSLILEITKEISYSIISRVLGGTKEINAEGRQFTEIELAIVERVLWQSLRIFDEAWVKIMDVSSTLEKIETSMQFSQIVDLNEPVLIVTLNVTIGTESGLIGFCLPHQALEPFIKNLNTRHMYSGNPNKKVESDPKKIIGSIKGTDLVINAEFNPTEATVRDITSLDVGDVIQLAHKVGEPLIVKYQQIPKYRASLGKYRNSLALKILDEIGGENENE
ncbi:MAG: flagellar motor switch protein FliM [Clostridiales bacterium]|nr:flagellar motor switch protein FliM [Clostridiales bacterium]